MSYAVVLFRLAVLPWGNQGKPGLIGAKVKGQMSAVYEIHSPGSEP